jgi:hypothetical protein
MNSKIVCALALVLAGCRAAEQSGPARDTCPISVTRAVAEAAMPEELDEVERRYAVRFEDGGRCLRVTFTAPVRSEIGACGARATLARCDEPARPIARYALVMASCATRRGCDDLVPAMLEGTYGQEPAACAGRDPSTLQPDGSRLTVGTEGAVLLLRAPEPGEGTLPFDTLVLRVGGALPASAELGRSCRSETTVLPLASAAR